jgi:hypothetical protein
MNFIAKLVAAVVELPTIHCLKNKRVVSYLPNIIAAQAFLVLAAICYFLAILRFI